MKKIFTIGMALMAALMVFSTVALAEVTTNSPDFTFDAGDGPGEIKVGNAGYECSQLGQALGVEFTYSYKFNEDGSTEKDADGNPTEGAPNGMETANFYVANNLVHSNTITISNSDGTYFDWSSSPNGIGAVMVKAGTGYNVWYYDPQVKSDTHLVGYGIEQPKSKSVSHVTSCWNLDQTSGGEWCSPGYWRQDQHLDSWAATNYAITDSFSAALGYSVTLSKKGEREGASDNPTLLQVLQNPQWYGGDDFNAVGDLLSDAHPDVNFGGERVEDSCPLN